ncbi:vacuolar protein sorting-associated protein 13B-like [Sipha flava]|nr:vacuolar protein sorting-associated protein 13B-like [Sipha flava]
MSVVKTKIHFLQDVENISFVRYHCVSEDLGKHKLLIINLDEILIDFNFHKEGIITAVKSKVDFTLLSYEHLTEISIVKFLINHTSTHATNNKRRNNQCSIKMNDIQCQMGPYIVTLLNAAMDLWSSPSTDNMPYIICNDTCYTIVFRQADTDENIVLSGLEYYNYSWLVSTEKPYLQFGIKNEDHMSYWSEKLTVKSLNKKYLTIKDSNEEDTILIISMQQTSPVSIKIVISSTLKIMNKTEYLLDALIITEKRNSYDLKNLKHILTVRPYEVTPSLMLEPCRTLAVALRFSDLNSHWSDIVKVNDLSITRENTKSVIVKISKKVNFKTTSNDVLCHFIFEEIDNFPQLLILLLPPFVICSYLPNDTKLNVSIVKLNSKTSINSIEVKSAIEQKYIQKINLPVITSDNDDDVDIILSISEDEYMSSIVSVEGHIQFENKTHKNMIHGIEDHLNNPYALEKTNSKWPFVGNRFNRVQWKSGTAQHKIRTIQTIQNYGVFGGLGILTRLITIQPWALVVNTTGQSISLHSLTSVRCTLENMSVAVPTFADDDVLKYLLSILFVARYK